MTTNVVEEWSKKEIDVNNFPINLVACYMMTKGNIEDKNEIKGLEQERATWKEWVQTVKGGVVKEKEKRQANQNFVQIPLSRFKDNLKLKAYENGIYVRVINESYTSICSFL